MINWTDGEQPDPNSYFGFIYRIDDLDSGRSYIGKKQYWQVRRGVKGCKSRCFDKTSYKWKSSCWEESNWKTYRGSSGHLHKWMRENPNNNYRFTIIKQLVCRGDLVFEESRELWRNDVLSTKLPDGSNKYFNRSIAGIRFIPPMNKRGEFYRFKKGTYLFHTTKEKILDTYPELTDKGIKKLIDKKLKTHKGWKIEGR